MLFFRRNMTELEQRRIELLRQTRKLYAENYIPAIHPRYKNTYSSLYGREETKEKESSLGVRMIIAILLFCLFVLANQKDMEEAEVVSNLIQKEYGGLVDLPILD